jgi:hypothetical protein
VSIYTELLRLALDEEQQARDVASCSVRELADELAGRRLEFARSRVELGPSATRAAEWTADLIAHDVALVRLCQRLGVEQSLADPTASPSERERLLALLASGEMGVDLEGRSVSAE